MTQTTVSTASDATLGKPFGRVKNFIDGQWIDSTATTTVDIINPANGAIIGQTPLSPAADVNQAVQAAKRAFFTWRQTPVMDRCQILFRLKALLETHADEIAELITLENGKTLAEAHGDLRRGIQMVETACSMPTLLKGQVSEDIAAGIDCHAIRRPMGVFAAITPFNFPAMVPFWFWPFAIAAGNTFVLKPSERVPLTQVRIMDLIAEAGMPKGVINIVQGGKDAVNAILEHPDISGVSFVGSTPVAKYIYETAAKHGKRVQALGGAKNFMVVLPDAQLDSAVRTIFESCTGCAGQRCLAGSMIIGVADAYPQLEMGIVAAAKLAPVGSGLDPTTVVGPLISQAAVERVSALIQSAVDEGATLLLDGRNTAPPVQGGFYIGPTVIAGVKPSMRIAKEEVFGPVVLLAQVPTYDEAIAWLNSSEFANTASLFTSSGAAARKFSYEADPTMLGINIGVPAPMAFYSFGGAKQSFFGDTKAHGHASVDFYTNTAVTVERWFKDSSIW